MKSSAAVIAVALGVFFISFAAGHFWKLNKIPSEVLAKHLTNLERTAGGANRFFHRKRPSADNRVVVRPSPDLSYSLCVFDLSDGPVKIVVPPLPQSYWSVSIFDANTNSVAILNTETSMSDAILLTKGRFSGTLPAGVRNVSTPTKRGVVLVRMFAPDEEAFNMIDATIRPQMQCATSGAFG